MLEIGRMKIMHNTDRISRGTLEYSGANKNTLALHLETKLNTSSDDHIKISDTYIVIYFTYDQAFKKALTTLNDEVIR
jgi:hypothetical protein